MAMIAGITGSGADAIQSLAAMTQRVRQQRAGRAEKAIPANQDRDHDGDAGSGVDEASAAGATQLQVANKQVDAAENVGRTEAEDRAARQAFFKLLTDNGISPEQFRSDLLAALRGSQDGQVDRGATPESLPAGLGVDVTA